MRSIFYLYILTNSKNKVLYIGTTYNLIKRIHEHKFMLGSKFAKKYQLTKLVYFEQSSDMNTILHRERLMKKWKRTWKEDLIRSANPDWEDLYGQII